MKYYRNPADNGVYAYAADGSDDDIIPENYILMTDEEVYAFMHPPITPEQILATNTATETDLANAASLAMTPLFMSLQLGDATDDETVKAKAWQAYYRDLKLVDLTVAAPAWPVLPA
jgi:hypothetical protein